MSKAQIVVRYDGPILADHKMEVDQVAPAMLALSDLVKRANAVANGDRTSVQVLIRVDVEQHCFMFGIEIAQTILERARDLLGHEDVETAKKIAEWIGIIGAAGGTLFGLLKFLKGRKPSSTTMTVQDGRNVVQVYVHGDMYVVPPQVWALYKDRDAVKEAKAVVHPLTMNGYESLEFQGDTGTERLERSDAEAIQQAPDPDPDVETVIPPSRIRAWVKIRRAVYDGTGRWNIQYDKARDVTMNDQEWLERFQKNLVTAPPGSMLDVEMLVSEIQVDTRGRVISDPEYVIEKVHDVKQPSPQQSGMFDEQGQDQPTERPKDGED